jgi:hypothetical protein
VRTAKKEVAALVQPRRPDPKEAKSPTLDGEMETTAGESGLPGVSTVTSLAILYGVEEEAPKTVCKQISTEKLV